MTPFDDNDLIAGLHSALAERQSQFVLPDGIGDGARRVAQRRTATRALTAGVPLLAAAGVATALATGSGTGSKTTGSPHGVGVIGPVRPIHDQDTAYIINKVKAAAAADSQDSTVTESVEYPHAEVSADGSLTNVGSMVGEQYTWTAAHGAIYDHSTLYDPDGSVYLTQQTVFTPAADGTYDDTYTTINPRNRTYTQGHASGFTNPTDASHPGLSSTPAQVRQALEGGKVTLKGQTTVSGTPAIALLVATPGATSLGAILYVNSRTYQPLASVAIPPGNTTSVFATKWVPATAQNIAQAKHASIPAGYTKTTKTNDWGTTSSGTGNTGTGTSG